MLNKSILFFGEMNLVEISLELKCTQTCAIKSIGIEEYSRAGIGLRQDLDPQSVFCI